MKITPFALERYFALYEFKTRYLLSCSDCEALSLTELLDLADPGSKALWNQLTLGYTESPGHPMLRECIAGLYEGFEADNVMVAAPEECIFLLVNALLNPGDHVVAMYPAYQSLTEVARTIGCDVTTWEADEDRGWHYPVDALKEQIRDNTKLIVVNFPHNPTGTLPGVEDFRALVDLARSRNIYLMSDEMYRFLEVDPQTALPAACELYDRAITLGGLSKSFGLPGLRTGWLATRSLDVLQTTNQLKDYTTICNSAPSEILAIMALKSREEIIARQRTRTAKNLALLDKFFQEFSDLFTWNRPRGGSICLPRMTACDNTYDFCRELIEQTGIMLVPSRMFQFGDHHVRFGFGRENLPEVLARFADYLGERFR